MKLELRTSAQAPFGRNKFIGFRGMSRTLFMVLVFILMSLPLFTTFNEILTKIVEKTGLYSILTQTVVPFETRAVSVILRPLGIVSRPTISHLYIHTGGRKTGVFFSWNCLGWQSGVLLFLTFVAGLSGRQKLSRKLETILFGLAGTFMINLLRISVVVVVAYYFGQLPAILVHDYGGTLFTVFWFFLFWWLSYTFILEDEGEVEGVTSMGA